MAIGESRKGEQDAGHDRERKTGYKKSITL